MKKRLPEATRGLRTRLRVILVIAAGYLAYSSLADLLLHIRGYTGLPPVRRSIIALGMVIIMLLCLRGLAQCSRLGSEVIRDELTGLFTREYARHRLQEEYYRAKRYNHPLSLLLVDLDNFPSLNERFGRAAGGHLLRYFGELIPNTIRPSDIPARFGGAEFLIILPDTGRDEARTVAERLQQKVSENAFRIDASREDVRLTVSVGASAFAFPDYGQDAEEMITLADLALFEAKKAGQNSVSFYGSN